MRIFYVAILLWSHSLWAKSDSTKTPDSLSWPKTALVAGLATSSFGAAYYTVLRNSWWSENSKFHFANDFYYAANTDKIAHFYGGYLFSNVFYDGMRWAGAGPTPAEWTGAALSTLVQLAIETKDGFAPNYGFSFMDPTAGMIGSLVPILQHHVPALEPLRVKFGYWYHHNSYWDLSDQELHDAGYFIDDYKNQDFWFSYNPDSKLPKSLQPYWPDFLAPALGIGMDQGCSELNPNHCRRRYTLGLDYDFEYALGQNNPKLKRSLFYLSQYKLPAPSMIFWPKFALKIAYPITF